MDTPTGSMAASTQDRALRPWMSPGEVPATARVELSHAAGYEEARAVTPAELPSRRGDAEAR